MHCRAIVERYEGRRRRAAVDTWDQTQPKLIYFPAGHRIGKCISGGLYWSFCQMPCSCFGFFCCDCKFRFQGHSFKLIVRSAISFRWWAYCCQSFYFPPRFENISNFWCTAKPKRKLPRSKSVAHSAHSPAQPAHSSQGP